MDCPFEKQYPSQLIRDDEFFMKMAYNQAIEAWKKDEVPVGAVIRLGDEIIATAHNEVIFQKDPTAHAEILAITKASHLIGDYRLNEMTLYVTKEPCPMCAGAAIMSRLGRIVYAFADPKMGYFGGATDINEIPTNNHRCLITTGVLEDSCKEMIQAFFQGKRQKPNE